MQVYIVAEYKAFTSATVDLGGKSWTDVASYHIKWDNVHIVFKDGTTLSAELSDAVAEIDFKRPEGSTVYPVNADVIDYDKMLEVQS